MLKENVTAVIVSYYRPKRLKRCIESLHELENILVYDNNTTGQDLDDIKQLSYPNTNFIFNTENFGLTKAWNTGIIESKTDWVLLTCDDMIFDSDWLPYAKHILSCQYIEPETDEFYERSMVELNKLPDEDVRRLVFEWCEKQERSNDVDETVFVYSDDDVQRHKSFGLHVFNGT